MSAIHSSATTTCAAAPVITSPSRAGGEDLESTMTTMICLLRAVNVGGHAIIKMEALRAMCESAGLCDVKTYVQSGNIVFRSDEPNPARLAKKIGDALERKFGVRPEVILRTTSEMRGVIARNPFARRRGIEPNKLQVMFLSSELPADAREAAVAIKVGPEEVHCNGRELYIYFPEGMGQSKLPPKLAKVLKNSGTTRNWNTVTKLLQMAEALDTSHD